MKKNRVIVIGSGFGGLAAAIRLQSQGMEVTILEKRDLPGGRAYVYRQDGYTFDAGPTVITAPQCIEELFEVSGKRLSDYVELIPVNPFYRLMWEDGYRFDYCGDLRSTLQQIAEKAPQDVDGYQRFREYSKSVFKEGYERLAHVPFLDWWSMIRVSPQLLQLAAYRSVYSTVSRYVKDEHLRQAFSFHSLLVGGNPFATSSIYTLIHYLEQNWGVTFPRGGTGALVQALVKLFQEQRGRIRYHAEVRQILTRDGSVEGVELMDGTMLPADTVVSNADVTHSYQHLLAKEKRVQSTRNRLLRSDYSMSLFLIYFGVKKTYPELAHHNVLFGPRYRDLLRDIFDDGVLAEDFSLYLHAPTRTDPSMAPKGCESFYVLSPVPHLGKSKIDWSIQGPKYADKILDYLNDRYIPDLRKHLACMRIFTPADFGQQLNAHHGSAFSLEPKLTQSAFFRVHNRDAKIKGLYFVGAGTHPGAGVPGVINSAKATAHLILGRSLN